jgi:hypothetical protein
VVAGTLTDLRISPGTQDLALFFGMGSGCLLSLSSALYFIRSDRDLHYGLEECLGLTEKQIIRYDDWIVATAPPSRVDVERIIKTAGNSGLRNWQGSGKIRLV